MESTNKDIIYQGNSIISIEVLPDYARPVVIKKPSKRHPSRRSLRALIKEYEMTRSLNAVEGVRKALGQQSIENQPELILEYIDGETLSDYIERKTLGLREKIKIAVDLARILGRIHQQGVIHLDLNSKNILIGNWQQAVHLIDLGSASRIEGMGHQTVRPEQMLGTLAYISPEQTGRINRAVDERSDLYSLGIVLYELMTRQLPFDSQDPAELIHHHIAKVPVSPSVLSPAISEVISTIILKLLRKNAEERYQSAAGLQADLEKCLQRLKPDNTLEGFPIAAADYTSRLVLPQKLYGRESELKELVGAFTRACRETSAMMFVSGYSGIGKTVLVEELQQPVLEKRGYFIKGKSDQYLRNTPYSGITQAFTGFVSQVLTEPETDFYAWRETIQSALGELGKVVIEVVPALENIIGTQPDVPKLGGQEAENRFNYAFINFLLSVATPKHPLVLFIDDLQWIDAASLGLLKVIRSDFNRPGLLVIGAYRDSEVKPSHPLMEIIGSREEKGIPLRILHLDDLQMQHIETLLSDTLRSQKGIEELGTTIQGKTQGNPFFMRRLLTSLNEEGRIHYDSEINAWKWNIGDINAEAVADNVADLLAKTISQLPEETRDILKLAACIGNRFDLPTLAMLSGLAEQEVIRLLNASPSGQYVLRSDDAYEFVHDQVQQVAYALLDAKDKTAKHLEIGRLLLANTNETELDEKIFDIVNQYNQGADLLSDPAEIIQLAKLNLEAGRKAKNTSAFSASAEYFRRSASLLGENKWEDHYRLTLDVHNELIEACYLTIQNEEVKALFDTILDHVKDAVDSSVAYKTMIMSNIAKNELREAISLAEGYLETLDVSFDTERHSNLSIDELRELPLIKNEEKMAALEILLTVDTPFIYAMPERLPSLIYTMLNIISQYGNSYVSGPAYTWYAFNLCLNKQYHEGNLFGRLGVDLLDKYPYPGTASKIMDFQYAYLRHWEAPVHDLIAPLKDYHHIGMQEGNFEWGLYCLLNHTLLLWSTGSPLDDYVSEVEPSVAICKSKSHEITLLMFLLFAESARNLTGESANTSRLEGKWFSEEKMVSRLAGNDMLLALYELLKMTLSYLFGDTREAYQHIDGALKYRHSLNPHYLYTKISFYGGLSCIAGLGEDENDADRQDRLKKLDQFEEDLKLWADVAPMNYQHEYHLLQAEKSRVANNHWEAVRFYDKAIKEAQNNHFVHEEALANELYARFWLEQGNNRIAEMYMGEARGLYEQWGADAKVRNIENRYSRWFEIRTTPTEQPDLPDGDGKVPTTISQPITPDQIDLDSVTRASQLLSAETDLEQLSAEMMTLVMANSGAEKAVLLLRLEDDWCVQARSYIGARKHDVLLNIPYDPGHGDDDGIIVPARIFEFCRRTKEVLVVRDAQRDPRFAEDRMIQKYNIRSIACIPISSHGKLKAVLYLENSQMADAFSLERVEVLKHLSSQFGVSVENALLYATLKVKVRELQEIDERYEMAIAGSAAGIWDWDIRSGRVFYSDRLKELLGYTPDEFSGTQDEFWSRLHPDDDQAVRLALDKHLCERVPYLVDCRVKTKSGKYRWFHSRGQALWDEEGQATRMSGSLTDITERKQAEDERMESEERFRNLVEQSPSPIEILNPEGKIERVNSAWLRLWDLKEEEAAQVLEKYNMLTDPQNVDLGVAPLIKKAFEGEPVILPPIQYSANRTSEEFGLPLTDLRVPWIQCHVYPVKDKQGKVDFVVNTYMDITELRRVEREAREQRETLARVDRATSMGQLTGSISHELNQPLTGILSNAQAAELLLEGGRADYDELKAIVAEIVSDTKRASDVIRNLRAVFREQKGEFLPVDINAVVDETAQLLHSEFVIQQVVLTKDCASCIPMVDGNWIQIQQVLINLIMNGIQAMSGSARDVRRLHIATAYDANEVKAWVEDNGPGIDPDNMDSIFEPLATWKPGGTGMGLAISNSIIEAHRGRMWTENRPEGGARVGFTLPVQKKGQQA